MREPNESSGEKAPEFTTTETTRRSFLKSIGATAPALALTGNLELLAQGRKNPAAVSSKERPTIAASVSHRFIAIQLGARAFVDEGVDKVLDTLQEKAGVNVIMPAIYTYGEGMAGRQMPGQPHTDHGIQEYAEVVGGSYTKLHPEFYANSVIKDVRAPELGDFDILADVIPKAKARGIQTYALFEEKYNPKLMPNFEKIAEVDIYGRLGTDPCFNNPNARIFLMSLVEDWTKSNDLDGLMWESERQGPLNTVIGAHFAKTRTSSRRSLSCFCEYCEKKCQSHGIDFERTKEGFLALDAWVNEVWGKSRKSDGSFVMFWRLLLQYPELLAYERFWFRSQEEVYGLIYGTVKGIKPKMQVGWHIMHLVTMSPFYSADQNYARLAHFADFIKPSPYNNCGGPRMAQYVKNVQQTVFHDFTPEEVLQMHYKLMGYENEPKLEELPKRGLSADYVAKETRRALNDVQGAVPIYPGIDIDIPTELSEKRTTAADVKAATLAALKAGAQGVVLSRNYAEMRLTNLAGAGEAVREFGSSSG
jgi:hypothetical protein